GSAMTDLQDLVALSLLPSSWWRRAADRLRAGDPPHEVLSQLLAERDVGQVRCESSLGNRAAAALSQARRTGLAPLTWDASEYPAALAAIVDPPFVLWTRGAISALNGP